MKVSIVTISFNQAEFLERTLCSVLSQDYADIEYIVVDPGSTDGSCEILERYRGEIARLILEPDDGPASGLNNGLAASTGEIFGYINSDDMLMPGAVRRAVEAFGRYPQADVVYGHGYHVDSADRVERRLRSAPFDLRRAVLGAAVLVQQATFIRRDAVVAVGGFNPHMHACWDYELLIDLALAGKRFQRVDEYWGLFRNHPESISNITAYLAQIRRDEDRIFARVMGRPRGPWDGVRARVARFEKWLADPKSFAISVVDRMHLLGGRLQPELDFSPSCQRSYVAPRAY